MRSRRPMVFRPASAPGTTDRARFGAARVYDLDTGDVALVDAGRLQRRDGHRRRQRRNAVDRHARQPTSRGCRLRGRAQKYDTDKDGRAVRRGVRGEQELGEHFGWFDDNATASSTGQNGRQCGSTGSASSARVAIRPENAAGQLVPGAISVALSEEHAVHSGAAGVPGRVLHGEGRRHRHLA